MNPREANELRRRHARLRTTIADLWMVADWMDGQNLSSERLRSVITNELDTVAWNWETQIRAFNAEKAKERTEKKEQP